jgi:hypothetical protein
VITLTIATPAAAEDLQGGIVKGEPFAKCEEWARLVAGLPDGLEAKCEHTMNNPLKGKRLLAGVGERGIYLKKSIVRKDPDSLILETILVIAGGILAWVIIIAIVVWRCKAGGKKKHKRRKGKRGEREQRKPHIPETLQCFA